MNAPDPSVRIALRIPGTWSHPKELVKQMPEGYRLTPEALELPSGQSVEFGAMKADNQFAHIFRSSCRRPATDEELAKVDSYKVNATLGGPGGSLEAARTMMQAASALVRAGGAGVFIDSCALAHGAENWLAMTEDGGPDALTFAFVAIISDKTDVWTMGMHALGFREIIMTRADADKLDIIDLIRYVAKSDRPIADGDLIADLEGLRFQAFLKESPEKLAGSPMHNPFGHLRMVSMRDVAESN